MFPLLMCDACRAVRSGPAPEPDELVGTRTCGNRTCSGAAAGRLRLSGRAAVPLERHAAAEHPEWAATFEDDRRVIYRRT
jgi:hypothetical protein